MEKYQTSNQICRLCDKTGSYNINDHKLVMNDDLILISDALQFFSTIKLEDCNLSPMMCDTCTEELGQAYNFYLKVKTSELVINEQCDENFIKSNELVGNDDENSVEYIINDFNTDSNDNNKQENETPTEDIEDIKNEDISDDENQDLVYSEVDVEVRKRSKKEPNFQLTTNVYSILNKLTKLPSTVRKRKADTKGLGPTEKKNQTLANSILVQQFVLNETRINSDSPDSNEGNTESHNSNFVKDEDSSTDLKNATTNKKRVPIQPTHKITMDVSAVTLDSKQLQMFSNFDKIEDSSILYQCSYCEKAFATQYHLGIHTQKAHVCQHCLAGFTKVQDLYTHIKTEHSTFTCSICSRQMSTNSNLRAHVRNIHGVNLPAGVSLITLQK